jgi:peptide/nickel transport system permease protein
VWSYIGRRLLIMIPTLFGVTVVSFVIMQLAPGDPLLNQLGSTGTQSGQTREAYLIQKRDLKLDKPLLLNNRYFQDYSQRMKFAAKYRALGIDEIAAELETLARGDLTAEQQAELNFLRGLDVPQFTTSLRPPELSEEQLAASRLTAAEWEAEKRVIRQRLARQVQGYLQVWIENIGAQAVPEAIAILESTESLRLQKIGAVNCLAGMVVSPFVYTFSRDGDAEEEQRVVATWKLLWERERASFEPVDPDRAAALRKILDAMAESSRTEMFKTLQSGKLAREDGPFFAEVLLGESTRPEKIAAAEFLRLYLNARIQTDLSRSADDAKIDEVASNWISHYESLREIYHPTTVQKVYLFFADTQYAHMVWRLVTFQFGRSSLKTRDPVSTLIWNAFWESAPLVLLAQIVIYLVAVPAGVVAAVNRNNWIDRGTTMVLFLLYSIPPFVAGMMFLLFFAFGDYLKWFPMERLHSRDADEYSYFGYVLDYLWHATGPVLCLSVFSLAGLAMYGRGAMLDVLGQDYIRTARAKGLSGPTVVFKHALRNGMIPIITLFATFIPALLSGSVLVEYLFGINGLGQLSFVSIRLQDFPTLMALIYIDAIVVMLSILLSDILYVLVDPRITFEGKKA